MGLRRQALSGGSDTLLLNQPHSITHDQPIIKIAISAVSNVFGLIRIVICSVAAVTASKLSVDCV